MKRSIFKLLVANRGEIACRVIRTCKKLGIETVAVYSDADENALHTKMADEAVHIGVSTASESYLRPEKIMEAAKLTNADAIHPGYGFLSENPDFVEACARENILFIGPSASAMQAMALKGAAKKLMEAAGVPVVPGYHGEEQSLSAFTEAAEAIGYPVLLKAVAGGGGKGMRTVFTQNELEAAIEGAKREGQNAFGNPKLLLEKYIEKPRHIEIQIFADTYGQCVHLLERDCSIQRRHQKVVEEAPAPDMSQEMRSAMGEAAVKAAQAIGYVGAGTVEFIVDVAHGLERAPFYFMEMNTRLQVEHPVTELITGLDLVEMQIRVAEGNPIGLEQDAVLASVKGHAVEVRLYAEDPEGGFLPTTGTIGLFNPFMVLEEGQRVDAGFKAGDEVSIYYDPMLAKLIAWGENRDGAVSSLIALLRKTAVSGLQTNRDFLLRTLSHPAFRQADLHTGFIAAYEEELLAVPRVDALDLALAAVSTVLENEGGDDPWDTKDLFRLNIPAEESIYFFDSEGAEAVVRLSGRAPRYVAVVGDASIELEVLETHTGTLLYQSGGKRQSVVIETSGHCVTLVYADCIKRIARRQPGALDESDMEGPGDVMSPMPGKILDVKVTNGETVQKGQPLIIMEAMKMEQTIVAPREGVISGIAYQAGDQVSGSAMLLTVEEAI